MDGTLKIQSIGDCVIPGEYLFHSRYRTAINFIRLSTRTMVSLVTPGVGQGPGNVVIQGEDLDDFLALQAPSVLSVTKSHLSLESRSCSLRGIPVFDSSIDVPAAFEPGCFRRNANAARTLLLERAAEKSLAFLLDARRDAFFKTPLEVSFVRRFRRVLAEIQDPAMHSDGSFDLPLARVRGLGFGLTPSGDDFIAGFRLAKHVQKRHGTRLAPGASARSDSDAPLQLSEIFIQRALDGFVCERWKSFITTLHSAGGANQAVVAMQQVLEMGSTSGADTAVGFFIGVECGKRGMENDS